jgi:hypothetical protein
MEHYIHGWFLGISKGAMVKKLETIDKSSYMFLTYVEGAINELWLINREELLNKIPCQMDLFILVMVSLFVTVVGKRLTPCT